MLATTEDATVAPVEAIQESAKDALKTSTPVVSETSSIEQAPTSEDQMETDGDSEEDEKMEVDDEEAELEFDDEDMIEVDDSNIMQSRTRGVKIDFASLPESNDEEDDLEDADVVMDEE
ncbi:hypothetical protein HKX48_006894 [Thoreauomyces humboldtii]|nr:hypothetical protein HKX48_006894 [Thoreauomyces humboldtii]